MTQNKETNCFYFSFFIFYHRAMEGGNYKNKCLLINLGKLNQFNHNKPERAKGIKELAKKKQNKTKKKTSNEEKMNWHNMT